METKDEPISEKLLGRIAHRVYPQHLYRFSTTLLEVVDSKYYHLTDGTEGNPWQRCFNVLRHWYNSRIQYHTDLVELLQKAEDLGFIQKGTLNDIQEGSVWQYEYLSKCDTPETREELSTKLRLLYRHPSWQTMLLYPWLQSEDSFSVSDVYTHLQMETLTSGQVRQVAHYSHLFKPTTRGLLLLGKPGIGKTTFTHKVALDWAEGELGRFDFVFLVRVRDLKPDQTIANAIVSQLGLEPPLESAINGHLVDGGDKTLLILDGLDEKDLAQYPFVEKALYGNKWTCVTMATSRPNIAPSLKSAMGCVVMVTGFSLTSARDYVTHIISSQPIREQFFKELRARRMHGVHRVPILLQAVALLYSAECALPSTYTGTYEKLVFYLEKRCEAKAGLTVEEIQAAMDVVNELAFKGTIQESLVFQRSEVPDDNVYRLGILSGTKTVTGFNLTSSVQFPHKTFQEYATAGHVARQLLSGDREPWQRLKTMYSDLFNPWKKQYKHSRPEFQSQMSQISTSDEENKKALLINSTMQKFVEAIRTSKDGKDAATKRMLKVVLDNRFLDDEPDAAILFEVVKSNELTQSLTTEELQVSFDFVLEILALIDGEHKARKRESLEKIVRSEDYSARNFVITLQMIARWMNANPTGSTELLTSIVKRILSSADMPSFEGVAKEVQWLQDQANSMKIQFRFVLGRLAKNEAEIGHVKSEMVQVKTQAEQLKTEMEKDQVMTEVEQPESKTGQSMTEMVLAEIAEMLLEHAFSDTTGEVLSVYFMTQYLEDLMREANLSVSKGNGAVYISDKAENQNFDDATPAPAVVHIKGNTQLKTTQSEAAVNALKLEDLKGCGEKIVEIIKNMKNLRILEIQNISSGFALDTEADGIAEAICTTNSAVSIVMDGIEDSALTSAILRNLPQSTKRLTLLTIPPLDTYRFPAQVNLQCLYIDSNLIGVDSLLESRFPKLETLSIMSRFKWQKKDVDSLLAAVALGGMPVLKHLCVRFGNLGNHGHHLVEILCKQTLSHVDLMDTCLTKQDGRLLLAAVNGGKLTNLQSLNVLQNPEINDLVPEINEACRLWKIRTQCATTIVALRGMVMPGVIELIVALCSNPWEAVRYAFYGVKSLFS